jgi:ribosome-dependent ATPase
VAWAVFNISPNGSYFALNFGVILYVMSTTAFGLLLSSFLKTKVAAMFASAVITLIPALNLSGLLTPVSSLDPSGRLLGTFFPAAWFQKISLANFIKSLDFHEQWFNHLILFMFFVIFMSIAILLLKKQEA